MLDNYDPYSWVEQADGMMTAAGSEYPPPSKEAHAFLDIIRSAFDQSASILDVGCCDGRYYHWMPPGIKAKEYVGCDITEPFLASAQAHFPGVPFVRGDIRDLKFQDQSFDLVICPNVLMHLPELSGPMRELFRVARKYVAVSLYGARYGIEETHSNGFLNYWYPLGHITEQAPRAWVVLDWQGVVPDWDKSKLMYQVLFMRG